MTKEKNTLRRIFSGFLSIFMMFVALASVLSPRINAGAAEQWSWPLPPTSHINKVFLGRDVHSGVDIADGWGVIAVMATRKGKVVASYPRRCPHILSVGNHDCTNQGVTYGNYIVLEHVDDNGQKFYSLYAHLVYDSIRHKVGDTVQQGEVIGQVGLSGATSGPHLHFEIRKGTNSFNNVVNPMNYVTLNKVYITSLDSGMTYRLPSDKPKLPAALNKGQAFDVHGLIYSNRPIAKVWGGIYAQNTTTQVQYYEDTPKTYLYSLNSKFDSKLLFDKLPEGYYTYRIYAKDDKKEYKLVEQNFQVGNPVKKYTITLNPNGGSVSPTSITVQANGTYSGLPMTASKTGYTFDGWYTAASGGTKITAATKVTVTSNQTLYAHWKANTYTVTFDATGGEASEASKSVTYDSTYGTLPTPTRGGYIFNGWYTAASGGTKITADTKVTITANQTLYAQWTPLKGDCDNSGTVNEDDLVMLSDWLLGAGELTNWKNVDMNDDGIIDVFDLAELRRFIVLSNTSIKLSASDKELVTDSTFELTASASPEDSVVIWSSSDNDVATVSDGTVRAVGEGNAVIYATIDTGVGQVTAECKIKVLPPTLKLSSANGSSTDTYIYKTDNKLYSMVVTLPTYTTNTGKTATWSVVSGDAVISGNKLCINQPGTVTARASVTYNGKTITADYTYKRTQSFTADVAYTLRSKPSTSGSSLASIPKGTSLTVTEIDLSDSTYIWGKVTYNSKTGYVVLWSKDGSSGGIKNV